MKKSRVFVAAGVGLLETGCYVVWEFRKLFDSTAQRPMAMSIQLIQKHWLSISGKESTKGLLQTGTMASSQMTNMEFDHCGRRLVCIKRRLTYTYKFVKVSNGWHPMVKNMPVIAKDSWMDLETWADRKSEALYLLKLLLKVYLIIWLTQRFLQ